MMTRLVLISEFLSASGRDGCAVDDVTSMFFKGQRDKFVGIDIYM